MASSLQFAIPTCDFFEDAETFLSRGLEDISKILKKLDNPKDNHFQCLVSKTGRCDWVKIKNNFKDFANLLDKLQSKCSEHKNEHEQAFRDHPGRSKTKRKSSTKKTDSGIGSVTSKELRRGVPDAEVPCFPDQEEGETMKQDGRLDNNKMSDTPDKRCSDSATTGTGTAAQMQDEAQTRLKCLQRILNEDSEESSSVSEECSSISEECSSVSTSSGSVKDYSLVDTLQQDTDAFSQGTDTPDDSYEDSEPHDISIRL
ncbi:unnamed protein product [Lymnaea stagnalis]|uniref:Uncharacterized protein n=1 Tax=Lymnaea stagnalis TaxID=6523 RepID=A0AAV2H4T3_LYMST